MMVDAPSNSQWTNVNSSPPVLELCWPSTISLSTNQFSIAHTPFAQIASFVPFCAFLCRYSGITQRHPINGSYCVADKMQRKYLECTDYCNYYHKYTTYRKQFYTLSLSPPSFDGVALLVHNILIWLRSALLCHAAIYRHAMQCPQLDTNDPLGDDEGWRWQAKHSE